MKREGPHPIGTPRKGLSSNTGALASAAWLTQRGIDSAEHKWFVEIVLAAGADTRLRIEIYAEEWGFVFEHGGKESWIRVTDVPFVHGRDEHGLIREVPTLRDIGKLIAELEARYGIELARQPNIRSSIADADSKIRAWAESL